MKNVWIKRICSVLCLLVITGVLCVLGVVMGYKESLKDFFEHSKGVIALEDLEKGFIPQGIGYDATGDTVFITGYMDNGRKSPIYAYDRSSGKLKNKILMLTEEGDNFRGHAGGLSVYGDRVYIAGSTDACMFAFSIEEILGAPYEGTVRAADRTSLKRKDDFMRVSFTSVDENYLYAGEFHKGLLFYTHASHKVTAEGVTQKAYVMGYTLDDQGEAIPGCVYSIPDNVQGACFHDGYIYLSQSAGFFPGHVLAYRLEDHKQCGTRKVLGAEVPVYMLTEHNASKITTVPPMNEEITVVGDQMYLLFEAASNRYMVGKMLGLEQVYGAPVAYFH